MTDDELEKMAQTINARYEQRKADLMQQYMVTKEESIFDQLLRQQKKNSVDNEDKPDQVRDIMTPEDEKKNQAAILASEEEYTRVVRNFINAGPGLTGQPKPDIMEELQQQYSRNRDKGLGQEL